MSEQITAITRFTLKDGADGETFAARFAEQAAAVGGSPGYLGNTFGRSARDSSRYVNLGWWASLEAYLGVVRTPAFQEHVATLAELVEADPDHVSAVGFGTAEGPEFAAAEPATAITWFTLHSADEEAGFRAAFDEHALVMREKEGFLGHNLLRSGRDPLRFVNAGWWRSPADYLATLRTPEFAADAKRMAGHVRAEGDLFLPVTAPVA